MIRFGQLWTLVLIASGALVAQDRPPALKIYVYNHAGVSGQTLHRAENRAHTIFRQSGIETSWYNCSVQGMDGENCSGAFDSGTVVVQIVHDSEKLKTEVFGTAFMGRSGYGTYADVFFDRVQQVCQDANIGVPDILGHIISHEIGHLLLGTDSHSRFGIMRAKWDSGELAHADRGQLLFLTAQSEAMRKRLVAASSEAAESASGR